jgi:hypothetical protein
MEKSMNRWREKIDMLLHRRTGRKSLGQSLVEFAVILPLLMIMLSGLIELGFAINIYLDLVDTAREVARYLSDFDPIHTDTGAPTDYNPIFYQWGELMATHTLAQAGQIVLNGAEDDLIISVFQIKNSNVDTRKPTPFGDPRADCNEAGNPNNGGNRGWRLYCNYDSRFSDSEVETRIQRLNPSVPPNTGLVLVEIFYNYHMQLGLPWITAFIPDPILLHAYTFAPNAASEPAP